MEKAGDVWIDLPLNFFYLSHADDTVDIVVTSSLTEWLKKMATIYLVQ